MRVSHSGVVSRVSLVAARRRVLQSRATLVRPGMALGGARSRVIINWLS